VKADQHTRVIRVVVLTVSRKHDHVLDAVRLGAEAYIVKPVDFQHFARIASQLDFSWTFHRAYSSGVDRVTRCGGTDSPSSAKRHF
jgi:DNA-binding NarL/FixJ family response regulator